jgi:hypothetical protein
VDWDWIYAFGLSGLSGSNEWLRFLIHNNKALDLVSCPNSKSMRNHLTGPVCHLQNHHCYCKLIVVHVAVKCLHKGEMHHARVPG